MNESINLQSFSFFITDLRQSSIFTILLKSKSCHKSSQLAIQEGIIMHGQRRDEYKARLRDDVTAAKLAKKASQWHILSAELIKRRKQHRENEASTNPELKLKTSLETLGLIDKLLSVNPDPIYLWNHRRELLQSLITPQNNDYSTVSGNKPHIEPKAFIRQEQILTQTALQRNPKAYGAWFHRKWSIRQLLLLLVSSPSDNSAETEISSSDDNYETCRNILEGELTLCAEFLTLDERNFHCWNYRRFVVSTLAYVLLAGESMTTDSSSTNSYHDILHDVGSRVDGGWNFLDIDNDYVEDIPIIGPQLTLKMGNDGSDGHNDNDNNAICNMEKLQTLLDNEWNFTSEKIYQNFSNGSAFHYRSKLLPLRLYFQSKLDSSSQRMKTRSDWVQEEMELIRNATFTEPDDQTSWWYFRFILSWANPIIANGHTSSNTNTDDEEKQPLTLSSEEEEMVEGYKEMLYEEWTSIQELVEAEEGKCKWGLLGLYMISTTFCDLENKGVHGAIEYEGENWLDLGRLYLKDLKTLDPDRKQRYESMEQEIA